MGATKSPGDHVKMQILTQQVWRGVFGEADDTDIAGLWTTRENQALTERGDDVFCWCGVCRVYALSALYSVQHWFGKNGELE